MVRLRTGRLSLSVVCLLCGLLSACPALGQQPAATGATSQDPSLSVMRSLLEHYESDRRALSRSAAAQVAESHRQRMQRYYESVRAMLDAVDFESLSQSEKIDWLLLSNQLQYELESLDIERRRDTEIADLLPFSDRILTLVEAKRAMEPVDPRGAAEELVALASQIDAASRGIRDESLTASAILGNRAAGRIEALHRELQEWHRFYDGYDPLYSWWTRDPWRIADEKLTDYARLVRTRLAGSDPDALIGDPIGHEALLLELQHEMIPYTPEELVDIANREFAWCESEMQRAADDLGFNGDWSQALEHVKTLHVEPGEQPQMIRDEALEAIRYVRDHELVTVPPLCEEIWRMTMMSPERQKVNPFFLGGETIQVSFPTDTMDHAAKLMSMRGNNRHFARATVHHELIPGHHLQGFMAERYRAHRRQFSTPFLIEGWALHWEMLLWERGYQRSAEDRVGMLFWRSHRCARIIFSLGFHLNQMSAQDCVDFLVTRVGHERNNAEAEVRRSIRGDYGPLYQAAYMLGGLQMRSLHEQLVGSGQMTDREFHDAVLMENSIPLEMIRASLMQTRLTRDFHSGWRFAD